MTVTIDQTRLTVPEAARYLGMSEDTVRVLCREKKLPHYRAGGSTSTKAKILFRVETLDKWMDQQEKENCVGWEGEKV
ncbi:helix-turn-helix domain-containing protein [Paenibacillus sp. M2]|uniref:helix-turn-helix domain-containing protein n=1 Tax=Paenibacillus sp. M2 TaxID=3341793 RepID=UPI0039892FE5